MTRLPSARISTVEITDVRNLWGNVVTNGSTKPWLASITAASVAESAAGSCSAMASSF